MIFRSPDPVSDAERFAADCEEQIEKCPVCDGCGGRITSRTYTEVAYKWRIYRFCDECATTQYTSEYIREQEVFAN